MTVAIVISIYDGVILASDSATTMSHWDQAGQTSFLNVYNTAEKVFQLSSSLPVGTVTGSVSVGALFKEVRKRLDGRSRDHQDWTLNACDYSVEGVAERVVDLIFDEHYAPILKQGEPAFGFGCKVAGYSAESLRPDVWRVDFHGPVRPRPEPVRAPGQCGVSCDGEPEAISRLVFGYSQQTVAVLKAVGADEPMIERFIAAAADTVKARLVEPPMPMADAADLAEFLVSLSCQFARFQPGAATVGGAPQIATINAEGGFTWVRSVRGASKL
ncbi:hypothetical protein JZU48_01705 [bacterium]|nr:hypothetical protein [bacterium]